jgi:hypothetical protein
MADGRLGKCKECAKIDVRENRVNRIDYYKEFDSKRALLPHRVEARIIYSKTSAGIQSQRKTRAKYLQENPERRAAHVAFGNAVRDGRVIKAEACWYCGSTTNIHGHHADYSNQLGVSWLCSKCHRSVHKMTKQIMQGAYA